MKTCSRCKIKKEFSAFYKNVGTTDGYNNYCKSCQRDYFVANRSRAQASTRAANWKRYGINLTESRYAELLKAQQNRCAICLEVKSYRLHVDHNHATGQIRGLLCRNCNRGLGYFLEDANIIREAINYLKENSHADSQV